MNSYHLINPFLVAPSCPYNPCQNGDTCYRNGFGKDQETYCTCPGNYHGEQCEKVKKGEENN